MYTNWWQICEYIYTKIHNFFIVMTFRISPENSVDDFGTYIDDEYANNICYDDNNDKSMMYR